MNDRDHDVFRSLMAGLGETYGKQITKPLASIYWRTLKTYSIEQMQQAVADHLQDTEHGMFFPKPADLIRHMDGGTETRALNAWSKLIHAIRTVGPYKTVVFDDWRIHAVVQDFGGWQEVCDWHSDKMPFHQRDFERLYRSMRQGRQFPPKLVGVTEHHNEQHGFAGNIPEPVLIGDQSEAQKVLAHEPGQTQSIGALSTKVLEAMNATG